MIHPRTLLATIGAMATAFALVIGSVVFDAAASTGVSTAASPRVSTQASGQPENIVPMGYVITSGPTAAGPC